VKPEQIYLDNNATTRIDPRVARAIFDSQQAGYANPASPHAAGRRARRVLEAARETIGRLLGCDPAGLPGDRVLFTSGGTEANNLAVLGLAGRRPGRVIISSIEHPSVIGPAQQLRERGFDIQRLRVTPQGVVNLDHLRQLLTDDTRLVSVMLGNNETGVLQPVREIAAVCATRSIRVHTDAVQVVGKLPVDFRDLGVAALTVAPHKFHGPLGIGALILRQSLGLEPMLYGGFQQAGVRPGTECVALAEGFARALQLAAEELDPRTRHLVTLRDRLESGLAAEFPDIVINGSGAARLPHTSNLSLPGCDRQALLMALDAAGVACSTGSACASGSSEPSPVLIAMGLPVEIVESSLRFSLAADTTKEEIEQAIERISRVFRGLRQP
jgi:cysteine desulfurase